MMIRMSAISNIANVGANSTPSPLNEIVELLQTELDELLQQKARIRQQMRNLRRRVSILRANNKRTARRSRSRDLRAASLNERHLLSELARACRIAFLELDGTATPEELYSAIVRRASFSFSLLQGNAIVAIERALSSMAQPGESVRGLESQWMYRADASECHRIRSTSRCNPER